MSMLYVLLLVSKKKLHSASNFGVPLVSFLFTPLLAPPARGSMRARFTRPISATWHHQTEGGGVRRREALPKNNSPDPLHHQKRRKKKETKNLLKGISMSDL
eukprot:Lithocolla_globosa_v1_NODE_136_length_5835_cov_11.826644.p12 type:complete len:102 gc:universal NODE_136_length_5835_cov_11.826644:2479-2174(-)